MKKIVIVFVLLFCLPAYACAQDSADVRQIQAQIRRASDECRYEDALKFVDNLVVIARNTNNGDNYAGALSTRAGLLQQLGRFREARQGFEAALQITTAFNASGRGIAFVLNDLGTLATEQARFGEAESFYRQALKIRKNQYPNDDPAVVNVESNLAALFVKMGRYAEAEGILLRALAIDEKELGSEHPETFKNINNLGLMYKELGRFTEAEPRLKGSLQILEQTGRGDSCEALTVRTNLAELYQDNDRPELAKTLLTQVLEARKKLQGEGHPDVGLATNNLAWFYQTQNKLPEAEPLQRQALDILKKALGPDHAMVGDTLNNLAVLYSNSGRYAESEQLFKEAISVRAKARGADHSDVGQSMYRLARLYSHQRRFGEATAQFEQGLEIRRKALGETHPDVIETYDGIAEMYEAQGDLSRAAAASWKARDAVIYRVSKTAAQKAAASQSARHEIAKDRQVLLRFIHLLWKMSREPASQADQSLRESYVAAQWLERTEASIALAQMSVRQAKGQGAASNLVRKRQDLEQQWLTLDKQLDAAIAHGKNAARDDLHGLDEAKKKIDLKIDEIDTKLQKEFADYPALSAPQPLSLQETRELLKPDEALVQFVVGEGETFVWIVSKDSERWTRSDLTEGAIAEDIDALRCGLDPGSWTENGVWAKDKEEQCNRVTGTATVDTDMPPFVSASAYSLYKGLFGSVEDSIRRRKLMIVAAGSLGRLPFSVLVTKAPQKRVAVSASDLRTLAWLGATTVISFLPSAASMKSLRGRLTARETKRAYLGIGNPLLNGSPSRQDADADKAVADARAARSCSELPSRRIASGSRGSGGSIGPLRGGLADPAELRQWAPLPETAQEVCDVAKRLRGSSLTLLGAASTEARLKDLSRSGELAKFAIVHFATHGALGGEVAGSAEPGLILTPPATASEKDDGYLAASEIATLTFNSDWVVLSACNTAAAGAETSEALSGLARAFFYAGARALLVSHWYVDSKSAVELVARIIGETASRSSGDRAEALQLSMRRMIKNGTHPSRWAPFALVGESRK